MSRWNLAWLLGVPAALLCGLVFASQAPRADRDYDRIRAVVDVLAAVEDKYVDPLTDEQKQRLVEDMINGGLMRLDIHSQYLNPDALADFETSTQGEFGGVGILMDPDPKNPRLTVETPLPESPAYDAGVQPGDVILKVDDAPLTNLAGEEAVRKARKLITGKPGTTVRLAMLRGGAKTPEDVTLTRAKIPMHVVAGYDRKPGDPLAWEYLADKANKVALVRLTGFNGLTSKELKAALDDADKAGAKALILDLRDNPGGLLSEAVEVSDLFLAGGTIVSTHGRSERDRSWAAKDDHSVWERPADRPMAVLVNAGSASASEIVAAALKENGRAVVAGERSFGKGSVQKVFDLPNGAAVKLTTEKWLTPTGASIGRGLDPKNPDGGVAPDLGFEVKPTDDQRKEYYESLRRLRVIPGKPGVAPPPPTPPQIGLPPGYTDPVIQKAIDGLRRKLGGVGGRVMRAVAA